MRPEGEPSGINCIYRLYREEGLTVRERRARRRAMGTRTPILVEARANARWSLDYVHDQFALGRRFRVLNIVDEVTRECPAAIPDTSISGRRLCLILSVGLARKAITGRQALPAKKAEPVPQSRRSHDQPLGDERRRFPLVQKHDLEQVYSLIAFHGEFSSMDPVVSGGWSVMVNGWLISLASIRSAAGLARSD